MGFDFENPLPITTDVFPELFLKEIDHRLCKFYYIILNSPASNLANVRRQIVSTIVDISRDFDPFVPYLAVTYVDRFLSAKSTPMGNPLIFRLFSVCCVSLALKMRKTEFSVSDLNHLMDDGGKIFDSVTIERMELLILGTLEWRMRTITPFAFLYYFISFFKSNPDHQPSIQIQAFKDRATELILKAQNDITLLDCKPSTIAASAVLFSSHEFFPMHFQPYRDAACRCMFVIEEDLERCYDSMQEAADRNEAPSAPVSGSSSPVNVLDFSSQGNRVRGVAGISGSENRGIRRQETANNSSQLSQRHQ